MPGVATAQEVTEARREDTSLDDNTVGGSRINQIGPARNDRGKDDRGKDRD